jgi:thiol-disulfide isomerase/thioredoxin
MKKISLLTVILCAFTVMATAQIPSVTLKTIDGKTINTDTLNNGSKPFIISFFAAWCKPCLRELNAISEVYADWQDETGVKIFAVSIDEAQNVAKVKPLVDKYSWDYDVILDPNSELKRALNVQLIPHVFVFDGKGKIAESRSGYVDGSEEHLLEKVKELLAEEQKEKTVTEKVTEAVIPVVEKITEAVTPVAEKVVEAVSPAVNTVVEKGVKPVVEAIKTKVKEVKEKKTSEQ